MNNVTLVGRLTNEANLRYTPNGDAVASFTVAVPHDYVKEGQERGADFINCVTWRKQAENLANYTEKGQRISVVGKIKTRNYVDEETQKTVWVTEVHAESVQFLDKPQGSNNNDQGGQQGNNNNRNNGNNNNRNNSNNNRNNNYNNYNNNRNNSR
ncbi:single-stranded DNA-binding protein [Bacillus sp. AFS075034]|uniref:single-stranded DNA-binding protein n=1 Tax=Bacillus sp. AFS075034 TaxID=2034281 RepID=UPI000BF4C1C1|nr:single-stranded DNA-binding protein [Bacillus sp. AFS075034]PFW63016.1 single-stranded DNA-binding protein [Bacillus sp. AFS075034]